LKGEKMITVYIASPYTKSDVSANVRKSINIADQLVSLGYVPFVPLLSHFWDLISPKPYDIWLYMDLEWIDRCDCLLRLPGESTGADIEVDHAAKCNIPVYHSVVELLHNMVPFKQDPYTSRKKHTI
jgi:hypothetical protein